VLFSFKSRLKILRTLQGKKTFLCLKSDLVKDNFNIVLSVQCSHFCNMLFCATYCLSVLLCTYLLIHPAVCLVSTTLSVCPTICQPHYLSFSYLSSCLSPCLSDSAAKSICLPLLLFALKPVCLSACLSAYMPVCLCLYAYLLLRLSVCPSVVMFACPTVCLFSFLLVSLNASLIVLCAPIYLSILQPICQSVYLPFGIPVHLPFCLSEYCLAPIVCLSTCLFLPVQLSKCLHYNPTVNLSF
jgi:hypothetical protein